MGIRHEVDEVYDFVVVQMPTSDFARAQVWQATPRSSKTRNRAARGAWVLSFR